MYAGHKHYTITSDRAELPGPWFFPEVASWITSGGRLLLGMLQKCVEEAGGTYLMCDTDSMAIVSTQNGGLVPCEGGSYRLPDGRQAVLALSWKQVDAICQRFQKLNPYNKKIVKELLKVEDYNYDRHEKRRQLYACAVSAKRYVLFTKKEIIKASEHGLGVFYNPIYKDGESRYTPSDCKEQKKTYAKWIVEGWELLLGMKKDRPSWLDYLSMRKFAITTPNQLKKLRMVDKQAAKPGNFGISPIPSMDDVVLVAPFCDDPKRWRDLTYVRITDGAKGTLGNFDRQTLADVFERYPQRPEFKSLAPDGSKCKQDTQGLLRRRPVLASEHFNRIGKEVDRSESEDNEVLSENQIARYSRNGFARFPESLRSISNRDLASQTNISKSVIARVRSGKRIHPNKMTCLLRYARKLKRINNEQKQAA